MTKQAKGAETAPKSDYAGIGGARAQRPANYYKPGIHALIRVLKVEEGEDRFKVKLVAVQGMVIHTFPDSAPTSNRVGEEVSEVIKRTNVAFAGRLKAFAMAAGNLTEQDFEQQEFDGQIFDELVGEDQPAQGVVIQTRSTLVLKRDSAAKPEAERTAKDFYTRVDFLRRVPFAEVKEILLAAGVEERVINMRVPKIDAEIAEESKS